jgi:hypothetical protein
MLPGNRKKKHPAALASKEGNASQGSYAKDDDDDVTERVEGN